MIALQRAQSIFVRMPPPVRLMLKCALLFALSLWAAYWIALESPVDDLAALKEKEEQLRSAFLDKKKMAMDLPAHRAQLQDLERQVGAVLQILPSRYDNELDKVMRAATIHGLRIDQMNMAEGERLFDFYAQSSATLRLTGTFHDLGALLNDVAGMRAFIVVQDFRIQNAATPGAVSMDAVVSAYRYLDEEEIAWQRKKAVAAKKGGRK